MRVAAYAFNLGKERSRDAKADPRAAKVPAKAERAKARKHRVIPRGPATKTGV